MGMSFQDTITVGSVHIKDISVPQKFSASRASQHVIFNY